jgi:hypothetical protein
MGGCGCDSYGAGHNVHQIQAKLANQDSTSWFDATVVSVDAEKITLWYPDSSWCGIWRHGGFDERVVTGTTLLVSEPWSLISVVGYEGRSQLSVEITDPSWRRDGLPEDRPKPEVGGIVDLATGEGIDIVHDADGWTGYQR